MANTLYDPGREGFLAGEIDWNTATIKAALVDAGAYTVNLSTDKFVSVIPGGAIVATQTLTSTTVTNGVADAANVTFPGVTGASVEALVLYQASAVGGGADVASSAQRLIAYMDTATGLPAVPNGSDLIITWDDGVNKIFKL